MPKIHILRAALLTQGPCANTPPPASCRWKCRYGAADKERVYVASYQMLRRSPFGCAFVALRAHACGALRKKQYSRS